MNDLPEPTRAGGSTGSRNIFERAILVPVGALLLATEELIGVATALTDAEKATRELVHFEERGRRAQADVARLAHHHRGRVADGLDDQIERARRELDALAERSKGISSKIRPKVPTST